ncbi:hypothetical protein PGC35_07115 [Psychrobacillus sp. PGGUH221]
MKNFEITHIIEQPKKLKVNNGPNGESLISMDYQDLKSLLAREKAINE